MKGTVIGSRMNQTRQVGNYWQGRRGAARAPGQLDERASTSRNEERASVLDVRIRALTIDLTLYTVSLRDVIAGVKDRYTIAFVLALILYMMLAHPEPSKAEKGVPELVFIFSLAILYVIGVMLAACFLTARLARRWPRIVMPVPLVFAFAVISLNFVFAGARYVLFGTIMPGWNEGIGALVHLSLLQYLYSLGHEIIYFKFIVPRTRVYAEIPKVRLRPKFRVHASHAPAPQDGHQIREEIRKLGPSLPDTATADGTSGPALKESEEQDREPPALVVGKQEFNPETLLAIIAEEHYMRVIRQDGEELVYAQLSRLVENIPGDIGMRVHRSFWVSYRAVQKVTPLPRGRLLLNLVDGRRIYVSRQYRTVFLEALSAAGMSKQARGGSLISADRAAE